MNPPLWEAAVVALQARKGTFLGVIAVHLHIMCINKADTDFDVPWFLSF